MSFGALSEEAKIALARGAEQAGTGICSGEGGMLPEEQAGELALLLRARLGALRLRRWTRSRDVQAFHFKGGQGAKTGTGGHLPGHKVDAKIAEVRGLDEGTAAISPARFPTGRPSTTTAISQTEVRERTGGIPIGFKLSAQHVETRHRRGARGRGATTSSSTAAAAARARAADLPRQHLRPDDSGAGPRATPSRPIERGDVTLVDHGWAARTLPTS